MRVEDIMMCEIATCAPDADLASVARTMWDKDCGSVPVMDADGRPIGMITDRDISIAGATQHRPLSDIPVSDVKSNHVVVCKANENIKSAIEHMVTAKVRRLPVVDQEGKLAGLLSMGDIVAKLPGGSGNLDLASEDLISALQSVYVHH